MRILKAVENVNYSQKSVLFSKLMNHFNGDLNGKKIALWGLSFKPNTDDMREAPSLVLIDKIIAAGASVVAYDPVAIEETQHIIGDKIEYAETEYKALKGADALLLVTEWAEFRVPDFKRVKELMNEPVLFDGRNLYNPESMEERGFTYYCIGIRTV
jgi:UDPglucose 6-dehydrogenase